MHPSYTLTFDALAAERDEQKQSDILYRDRDPGLVDVRERSIHMTDERGRSRQRILPDHLQKEEMRESDTLKKLHEAHAVSILTSTSRT